jgi:hypothetical protein
MNAVLLFGGGVTGEPRPTHPSELVQNAWRQEQYAERLKRYFAAHAYPHLAELEVARQAGRGPVHLVRLRAWWAGDRPKPLDATPPADVVAIARRKKGGR